MRVGVKLLFVVSLAVAMAGCASDKAGSGDSSAPVVSGSGGGAKPFVFFSQANSGDPWRQVFDRETQAAADLHKEFTYEKQSADDDPNKQIGQIESALVKKPAVLLVSPATVAVQNAIEEAHKAGAFVVLLDRSVPGTGWDVYVGGDNHAIGVEAGKHMGEVLKGKGTVLMIQGIADAPPTKDRASGFMEAIRAFPGIKVIAGNNCDYQRVKAESYMENFLQSKTPFDAVYAHNDEMAIGALMAMKAANTPKKVVIGIDCCQKEVINMIKSGDMEATFSYPDPGPKGIEIAANAIAGQKPAAKKISLQTTMVTKANADQYLAAHPGLAN